MLSTEGPVSAIVHGIESLGRGHHLLQHIVISAGQPWLYCSRLLSVEKADIRRRCDKNAFKEIIEYYLVFLALASCISL